MLFNTFTFWVFFAVVLGLYCVLSHRWQNRLLLVGSYVFYGCWDWGFLSLILLSTVVDYLVGARLAAQDDEVRRKRLLWVSLSLNLGLLGVFKYFGFFAESAHALLTTIGLSPSPWTLKIILPVGISFYTFQTLSYTIDIYRRRLEPSKSFFDFALFVAFFPQLVAGPIERAKELLPQIYGERKLTSRAWGEGFTLILVGLFKKVAIADMISPLVDLTFSQPGGYTSGSLLVGLYLFSFQIYADFSGYSDIARGLARILGFELMVNFNQPYFAASITEFWRRWHISLSTWLRDYLYITLGGNRKGRRRTYINLMLTMLLGGLWHGASWTFVVWGGLHGLYLAAHKLWVGDSKLPDVPAKVGAKGVLLYAAKVLVVFHLVALTWIFFRAETFPLAYDYLAGIFSFRGDEAGALSLSTSDVRRSVWAILTLVLLVDVGQYVKRSHTAMNGWRLPLRVLTLVVLFLWLFNSEPTGSAFIYFQF